MDESSDKLWPDGTIPPHHHKFEWEDLGGEYEENIVGVVCTYQWLVPPRPRGKKPRSRMCSLRFDMGEVLEMIQKLGMMASGSESE